MLKRILTVLHEQRIGNVISAVFVLFALQCMGETLDPPFLNRVTHFFNTHTTEYPNYEPPFYAPSVALNLVQVVVLFVVAILIHRWSSRRQGESRG